ncbi:MAG TPA: serine hydrolase domain-containing protein, partial [Puia sp.]|nr:serine hydrolase domain-containing protein [Puia sp.]
MKQVALCLLMANFAFSSLSQDIHQQLDSLFNTCYHKGLPGAAIVIEWKGKIVFKKGYGLANQVTREPIDSITNFNIGSLTKQFTAYCILRLAEQKRLSLDDNLSRFFPGFNPSTGNQITVRQLLTHSSGILDHYAFIDTNLIKHAADKDVLQAVRSLDHTYFVPGTQYRYSNTAYCLLALIIEELSGLSYADYVRKHVFEPLSMKHSQVLKIGTPISRRAVGYDTLGDTVSFRRLDADESIFFSTEGDGGVYTSVEDYLR